MNAFFKGRLPVPPSINDCYAIGYVPVNGEKKPRIVASAELKLFKEHAAWMLKDTKTNSIDWQVVEVIQEAKRKRKQIPLEATFHFYFNSMWRRDIDGGEKHAQDAICKHLHINDNLVIKKLTFKNIDKFDPRVEVELSIIQE